MARQVNLSVDQGTDWSQNVVAYINATSSTTINLYQFANGTGMMRKSYDSVSLTANIAVDIHPMASANAGIVTLSINNSTTSSIAHGRYLYDVEIIGGPTTKDTAALWTDGTEENKVYRICEGILTIRPQITKDWDW